MTKYSKTIGIEARTALQMAKRQILPACLKYSTLLAQNSQSNGKSCTGGNPSAETKFSEPLFIAPKSLEKAAMELEQKIAAIQNNEMDFYEEAVICRDGVLPIMNELRKFADTLETITDQKYWPMPTYSDLIL